MSYHARMLVHPSSPFVTLVARSWLLVLIACAAPADPASRARDVERRILAPCCRRQILEDHDSDIARALRAEIERRIDIGEQPAAIEENLVARYGEDIRAMPRGGDSRSLIGIVVGLVLGLGGIVVLWFMRRRAAPSSLDATRPAETGAELDYEGRLDDELLAVD